MQIANASIFLDFFFLPSDISPSFVTSILPSGFNLTALPAGNDCPLVFAASTSLLEYLVILKVSASLVSFFLEGLHLQSFIPQPGQTVFLPSIRFLCKELIDDSLKVINVFWVRPNLIKSAYLLVFIYYFFFKFKNDISFV